MKMFSFSSLQSTRVQRKILPQSFCKNKSLTDCSPLPEIQLVIEGIVMLHILPLF